MMDMGVASPRAHGQAMISTATALTMAWESFGSGPSHIQRMKVMTETANTVGTKITGDPVGKPLDRRAAALGLGHHFHDLSQQGVATHPLGAHHEAAGAIDGAGGDGVAYGFLHRQRLAGDHGFLHAGVAFH